ncbi:MAG: L,D-transpeptidase family protein [Deferribacterales bacterium]
MSKNLEQQQVFIVDKGEKKSYLLEIKNDNLKIIKEFNDIIIGAGNGDKLKVGDLKTPVGIYYVTGYIPPSKLSSIYGTGAFPLNYPNFVDKLNGKTGYGIWIHGRDPKEDKQASKGCVVLHNKDIDFLKGVNFINTPVIITEHISYTDLMNYNSEKSYWLNFLNEYYESWKNNDINRLSKLIHVKFKDSKHSNYSEYIKRKKRLMELYPEKTIIFDNIKIFKENDSEVVYDFDQYYSAPNITTFGTKRLYLIKEVDDFKIMAEEFIAKPTPDKYKNIAKNEPKQTLPITTSKIEDNNTAHKQIEDNKKDNATQPIVKTATKKSDSKLKKPELSYDEKDIKQFVQDWAEAWMSKDIDRYISFYSEDFKSGGLDYNQWKEDKAGKFSRIRNIKVEISNIKIKPINNNIEITFVQHYQTEAMKNKGLKKLILNKTDKGLKIISEGWSPIK